MAKHQAISAEVAGDRLAIRELVEAYAHSADRREAKGRRALFTADTHFVVYMNAKDPTPSQKLYPREALALVFADLNKYTATTHFVGQSTIFALTGDRAEGEAYCLAPISRHVREDGRRVAVFGASAVRRLVRGARTFMTPANEIASMIPLAVPRGRG
jgi:hypothetical protein